MGKWRGPPHGEIPRCGAKTRSRGHCGHFAMKNGRCRYHGGKSTGAKSPHRTVKHGRHTQKSIAERRLMSQLLKDSRDLLRERF